VPQPKSKPDNAPHVTLPGEKFEASGKYHGPTIERPADQVPSGFPIPDVNSMSKLSTSQKLKVAQRYGWREPPRSYREDVSRYVSRFSTLGPEAHAGQVDDLLNVYKSKRAGTQMARSSYRNYQQQAAQNGNPNQNLVWVGEDDENTCDGCDRHEGDEGTLEEIKAGSGGGPGMQECGGQCRCDTVPAEPPSSLDWLATGARADAVIESVLGEGMAAL
jgi:hypothetical protein